MIKKLIAGAAAAALLFTSTPGAEAAEPPETIYYIPHQDDELLSMGVSITNHLAIGSEVHLVLYTNGTGSYLRTQMGMSAEAFQTARNKEFIISALSLGVDPNNIHFENYQDGAVTVEQTRKMILKYEAAYPGARHKAYSYHDKHNDHAAGGKALNELYNEGKVKDARFYINYGRYDTPGIVEGSTAGGAEKVKMAAAAYNINNAAAGLYGIGYRSAGEEMFINATTNIINRYHKPNE